MSLSRRKLLRTAGLSGALLVARPLLGPAGAALLQPFATSRASRLRPQDGRFVVHTDLHNHTLLSDGVGEAGGAYRMMRTAGLDVASLTDHAVLGKQFGAVLCTSEQQPDDGEDCSAIVGINEDSWAQLNALADAADEPGSFTGVPGFEWTSSHLGHVNVWFSDTWIDSYSTNSLQSPAALGGFVQGQFAPLDPAIQTAFDTLPDTASIAGFYEWLQTPVEDGGGLDAIAGFNHPNEYGNFEDFRFEPGLVDRLVSVELHNGPISDGATGARDYFFRGVADGDRWPLNALLNGGWRVGCLGVSDNHASTYGKTDAARGGLWVRELTRDGVREALLARRMFSTTVHGLRLDVTANGIPMGGTLGHTSGPVQFAVDLDAGDGLAGRDLVIEVVRPGTDAPVLADAITVIAARPGDDVLRFAVDIDIEDGGWVVLRVCDPAAANDPDALPPFDGNGGAIAYASPIWFASDGTPPAAAVAPDTVQPAPPPAAPTVPPAPSAPGTAPIATGDALPATGAGAAGIGAVAGLGGWLLSRGNGRGHDSVAPHDHDRPAAGPHSHGH